MLKYPMNLAARLMLIKLTNRSMLRGILVAFDDGMLTSEAIWIVNTAKKEKCRRHVQWIFVLHMRINHPIQDTKNVSKDSFSVSPKSILSFPKQQNPTDLYQYRPYLLLYNFIEWGRSWKTHFLVSGFILSNVKFRIHPSCSYCNLLFAFHCLNISLSFRHSFPHNWWRILHCVYSSPRYQLWNC